MLLGSGYSRLAHRRYFAATEQSRTTGVFCHSANFGLLRYLEKFALTEVCANRFSCGRKVTRVYALSNRQPIKKCLMFYLDVAQ
jgi:hypothetical protein